MKGDIASGNQIRLCGFPTIAIGCQLLLITNMKSHAGFRFVPIPMILNDLERHNSPYFAFSPNSIALLADYITVVEDRPIMSVNIVSQFQSSTFGQN